MQHEPAQPLSAAASWPGRLAWNRESCAWRVNETCRPPRVQPRTWPTFYARPGARRGGVAPGRSHQVE